jgi:hypothetical protein
LAVPSSSIVGYAGLQVEDKVYIISYNKTNKNLWIKTSVICGVTNVRRSSLKNAQGCVNANIQQVHYYCLKETGNTNTNVLRGL